MKNQPKLKNSTVFLLLLGTFCMSFPLFTQSVYETPVDLSDFFKGLGAALVLSSLFMQTKPQSLK